MHEEVVEKVHSLSKVRSVPEAFLERGYLRPKDRICRGTASRERCYRNSEQTIHPEGPKQHIERVHMVPQNKPLSASIYRPYNRFRPGAAKSFRPELLYLIDRRELKDKHRARAWENRLNDLSHLRNAFHVVLDKWPQDRIRRHALGCQHRALVKA